MDFQKLLLDVGKALSTAEVKALAYLCIDLLAKNPTSVESASDLFSRLADQDALSAEQPHLLTELLLIIQRPKVIREFGLSPQAATARSQISPFRKLLYNLSEEITGDDLKNVKFMLSKTLPRRKLEENVSTLEVFLEMEHMDLINDSKLDLLDTILQSVCPVLIDKINRFKAQQETHPSAAVQQTERMRSYSFDPYQVPQSLRSESTSYNEIQVPSRPLAESSMNPPNTSTDLPNVFSGDDASEALSHGLRRLNTETSSVASWKGHVRTPALTLLPAKENMVSPGKQMSPAANTEVLETYPMTAAKKSICFIVNNYDFTPSKGFLQNREGTMLDEECLNKVFTWLGFEVVIKRDCKKKDMVSALQELGSRNHSHMDCLVCCILSHGLEGAVYGVDGQAVEIKKLLDSVDASKCASLAKKPKVFFIQACQGSAEQKAVRVEADGPTRGSVSSDAFKASEFIPAHADFLIGMATISSYVSFRERTNGTWFIQSLCQNLVQMVPRGCDLVTILTKVNADVSQRTDSKGTKKQMPQPSFSLRKKLVFPVPVDSPPSLSHDSNLPPA